MVRPTGSHTARTAVSTNGFSNGMGFGGTLLSSQNILDPGFGFGTGFNQNLGIEAAIDPATQWRLFTAARLLRNNPRFAGSSFYLLDGGGAYALPDESADADQPPQQPQQQQPIIVVQQQPAAESAPEDAPLPDVGQFTLVLRNGTQIQAVAFTRANDRIVYITADGSRRTIASADLNLDETVRINQERGTPLQLPL